jgi:hypothetical protein
VIADLGILLARAVDEARTAGAARYLVPVADDDTGAVEVQVVTIEPAHDHLRVDPDGVAVAVYLPSDD